MKKVAIAFGVLVGLLAVLVGIVSYGVWSAEQTPIAKTPGAVETGRTKLHAQLEEAKQREAQFEKQDWNSPTALRELIKSHQQRIDQLTGDSQAAEILAYDRDSITRLEKRINDLAEQQSAQPAAAPSPTQQQPMQ